MKRGILLSAPQKNSLLVGQQETIRRDIISGELNDGRNIKFIGCVYNGRMFEAQGYVYSSEYVFLIGRCMTYIMILRSAGVNDEHTAKVIQKIFQ